MKATEKFIVLGFVAAMAAFVGMVASAQQPAPTAAKAPAKLYNTAKAKLLAGERVFSFTQDKADPVAYCEKAPHYDFAWFEMQHSTLEFKDVEAMIAACPHAGATPMIRLPDAQEWHIQHSMDIGALGVIIPTVDDVERAREGAKWARYPNQGRRSAGSGQFGRIWGINGVNYRQSINDNTLVVVMIESPTGVANAYEIAATAGVDVVIIGNNDMTNFSGYSQGSPEYELLIKKVKEETLKAGKIFGQAAAARADGPYSYDARFFQNGKSNDGWVPPNTGRGRGPVNVNAAPPGEEAK